ncbi:MAG: cation:proton antiporter [Gemmatimonadales bacterium]|nr:cation:proton antiporter [Gemmatimonadales bacterium]
MTELAFLFDLVVILAAAVTAVAFLRYLRVPSIAGFIIAGTVVGPHALGLVQDLHRVEIIAELGVVLLLFGIGLELSLSRVRRLWRPIAVGGAVQVCTTILVVLGLSLLFGRDLGSGLLLGFIVAVSSTAIVLRGLSDRGELETPHGRLALGILIFQDLCVVPMVLVIPVLGHTVGADTNVLVPLLKAAGVVAGVVVAARLVVPRFLEEIARTRKRDLFVLSVFLICLGTAWVVSMVGVSLALGAFLAGLVVSGSRYRDQAISDLVPLRDVLASVFFVSIGMMLDLRNVLDNLGPILGLFAAIIVGKFIIIFLSASIMRLPLRVGVLTAASLCQVGEFAFVLLLAAGGTGLLDETLTSNLTVAVILSMVAAPFGIALGPHLAGGLGKLNPLTRLLKVRTTQEIRETESLRNHVIIAGYGLTGRSLAQALDRIGTPYIIVDMNTENVREAAERGESACFGDVTSAEVLECLGIAEASELVIAINDPDATARATGAARLAAPGLRITVRTTFDVDVKRLEEAGATQVVAAEAAASDAIITLVLRNMEEGAGADLDPDNTFA